MAERSTVSSGSPVGSIRDHRRECTSPEPASASTRQPGHPPVAPIEQTRERTRFTRRLGGLSLTPISIEAWGYSIRCCLAVMMVIAGLGIAGTQHLDRREPVPGAVRLAAGVDVATSPGPPADATNDMIGTCSPTTVLDLSRWKLTLPTGSGHSPTQVLPVNLGTVLDSPFFQTNPSCNGVIFRAPVTGVTTPGSHYPRSELREMATTGAPAAWSSTVGTHLLGVYEAFTALPRGKPELVGAQIHDATEDITVFRLEGSNLWITNGNNPHYQLATDHYVLGTVFAAGFLVTQGQIGAYYNGKLIAQISRAFSNGYFKAGAYTQANCTNAPCDPNNFGETVIYALTTSHS